MLPPAVRKDEIKTIMWGEEEVWTEGAGACESARIRHSADLDRLALVAEPRELKDVVDAGKYGRIMQDKSLSGRVKADRIRE